jgi:hypothetical protein
LKIKNQSSQLKNNASKDSILKALRISLKQQKGFQDESRPAKLRHHRARRHQSHQQKQGQTIRQNLKKAGGLEQRSPSLSILTSWIFLTQAIPMGQHSMHCTDCQYSGRN